MDLPFVSHPYTCYDCFFARYLSSALFLAVTIANTLQYVTYSFPRGPVRCRGLDRSVYLQYHRSMSNWFKSGGSNSAMIVIIINGKQSIFFLFPYITCLMHGQAEHNFMSASEIS